jgi:hypothetical protein
MINLASVRYRSVMTANGGPIERIELGDFTVAGCRQFQANAYLKAGLVSWQPVRRVFSEATGSGTSPSPMVARFKAISEALERWAYLTTVRAADRARYGFEVDPSSTGMAAFPGWREASARPAAQYEAAERFNLLAWWEGHLPAAEASSPFPGVEAAVLCSDAPGVTVILHRRSAHGLVAYGHAAGPDFATACERAMAELERHASVVRHYALAHALSSLGPPEELMEPLERRSLFFASAHGHELFLERLRSGARKPTITPRLVYDGPVHGPWSRYTSVWRCVYAPVSDRFLSDDPTYFFW